ncbi:MAG: M28 family peptidase [Flavobacteriales bacterium]
MIGLKHILGIVLFGGALLSFGQADSLAVRYANTITQDELREHLTLLAGDAYQGRDTGKEGQKMAAAYLKEQFTKDGIPPIPAPHAVAITEGYFQSFGLLEEQSGAIRIVVGERVLEYKRELLYFNEVLKADVPIAEVVYLGDGEQLPQAGITGRVVLLNGTLLGQGASMLGPLRERVEKLRAAGASLVLVGVPSLVALMEGIHLGGSRMRLEDTGAKAEPMKSGAQMILVDEAAMDQLLRSTTMARLAHKHRPKTIRVACQVMVSPLARHFTGENVLAYIRGADKADEVVVITAHYDHIGVENGVVYNGADDDGSGTVALLEIAEAFAKAKAEGHGPRRSVLVMPVSGEEKGLLGSQYYSEHPVFPLENTVADLNIDMIGRVDSAHASSPPYVYVIGSDRLSSALHTVNEQANTMYAHLLLDYTFNAESDPNRFYYRSDHYNFARKGVPSVFFFSGVHEDYHQPGDDVDKIRFDLLQQRALLVFHTAWILANREERIVVDKPVK